MGDDGAGALASAGVSARPDDAALLAAAARGEEAAYVSLFLRYHPLMVRLARGHTGSPVAAEEVAQQAWLAVLVDLDRVDERMTPRAWIMRTLLARARARSQPAGTDAAAPGEPGFADDRFMPRDHARWPGHWAAPPADWGDASADDLARLRDAIDALPAAEHDVVVLRDVAGWDRAEVCAALGVREDEQRALLHRGRLRLRAALDAHLAEAGR